MRVPSVPRPEKLLEQAAKYTPGQAVLMINSRLIEVVQGFPDFDKLDPFIASMVKSSLDRDEIKQSLARLHGVQKMFRRFAHLPKKEFLGRLKSVLKKLEKPLATLHEARMILRRIPDPTISFTVCLAGFPNAGKSTLLKKLTGAKAEIADYSFTTKSLNYGTMQVRHHDVQVVDAPGTLNRTKSNVIERQALLALANLAKAIVFVYDPLREADDQEKLFETMFQYKVPLVIYAAKQDIVVELPVFVQAEKQKIAIFTKPQQIIEWLTPFVLEQSPSEQSLDA